MSSENPTNGSTLKSRLLREIARNQIISAEAINLIAEGDQNKYIYLRKILRKLISDGLVKKEVIQEVSNKTSITKSIYFVTKKGVQTLIRLVYGETVWQTVQGEVEHATLYGTKKFSANQIRKIAQIIDAKIIAEKAGAVSRESFSETEVEIDVDGINDEQNSANESKSFSDLIDEIEFINELKLELEESYTEALTWNNRDSQEQEQQLLVFANCRAVKKSIIADCSIDQVKDYDRCAFDGILESKNRFLMMYTSFGIGRKWHKWNIDKDIAVASFWNHYSTNLKKPIPLTAIENFEGVLLVKNAAQFAQILLDTAKVREKKEILGAGYKNFYVAPMTWDGVNHLRFLMTTDFGDADRQVAEYLIEKYGYRINNEFQPNTFFMISPENQLVINGIYMDIRRIQRALIICEKNNLSPILICFEWQIPFYLNLNFYWQILYIQGNKIE